MKNLLLTTKTFFIVICIVCSYYMGIAQDSEKKIKIEISKSISGKGKTFKGEYNNEQEMLSDPAYQEFVGEEDDSFSWFLHEKDEDKDEDTNSNHFYFKFREDEEKEEEEEDFSWFENTDNEDIPASLKKYLFKFKGKDDENILFDLDEEDFMLGLDFEALNEGINTEEIEEKIQKILKDLGKMKTDFDIDVDLDKDDGTHTKVYVIKIHNISVEDVEEKEFGKYGKVDKKEALRLPKLAFYPNPSNDGKLKISFEVPEESKLTLKIRDEDGNEVFRRHFERFGGTYNETIDLSGQRKGIYLLEIMRNKKRMIKKLILK